MSTLILRLSAPLQSWGWESRFNERSTARYPTKSGIVGLLANALGRGREDDLTDLASMKLAVRADLPGRQRTDFLTSRRRDFDPKLGKRVPTKDQPMPLEHLVYLEDACFVAAVELSSGLAASCAEALRSPARTLFLGRKACLPSAPLLIGVDDVEGPVEVLASLPWQASEHAARSTRRYGRDAEQTVEVGVQSDAALDGGLEEARQRDAVRTFAQAWRKYSWRSTSEGMLSIPNPYAWQEPTTTHAADFMPPDPFDY